MAEKKVGPTKPYRIEFHRAGCIECGACAKLVPDFWTMTKTEDYKADLLGSKEIKAKNGTVLKQVLEVEGIDPHWVAYECCPIKVIKLYDQKTGQLVKLRRQFNTGEEDHNDKRNDHPLREL